MDNLVKDIFLYISRFLSFRSFQSFRACSNYVSKVLDSEYRLRLWRYYDTSTTDFLLRCGLKRFIDGKCISLPSLTGLIMAMKRGYLGCIRKHWNTWEEKYPTLDLTDHANLVLRAIAFTNIDNNDDFYELFSHVNNRLTRKKSTCYWSVIKIAIRETNNLIFIKHVYQVYLQSKKPGLISVFKEAVKLNRVDIVKYFMLVGWEYIDNSGKLKAILMSVCNLEIFKLLYEKSKTLDIYHDDSLDFAVSAKLKDCPEIIEYLVIQRGLNYIKI